MSVLLTVLKPLEWLNTQLLTMGKVIAVAALAIMVCLILAQVFFRYVIGDALNWTEEAARFGMLWLTGLMAPLAFRQGGFVSIDMLERALPRVLSAILTLVLLSISMAVLIVAWDKGLNNHVDSLSGRGNSSTLRIPLELIGGENIRFKNQWQYASLWVGINLLILVNIELILRQFITLLGGGDKLTRLSTSQVVGAD
ncbi:Tripartite ATP-independent transporter, DctQ component [Cognatiyoonia koreensis]|uniref:TRAP transporter small permease protein n=1 Tax=Cognatiyoonia koreensis TaxID=364200 RepID=A0A1I0PUQ3_9RHOB|nr:TRAP transporter small permease subunit [Cognatiyoonia koreensis]SEW18187.1 Tripartite ATP-independent transporter, DctQ component [Cognatiyoonia koreensis]